MVILSLGLLIQLFRGRDEVQIVAGCASLNFRFLSAGAVPIGRVARVGGGGRGRGDVRVRPGTFCFAADDERLVRWPRCRWWSARLPPPEVEASAFEVGRHTLWRWRRSSGIDETAGRIPGKR